MKSNRFRIFRRIALPVAPILLVVAILVGLYWGGNPKGMAAGGVDADTAVAAEPVVAKEAEEAKADGDASSVPADAKSGESTEPATGSAEAPKGEGVPGPAKDEPKPEGADDGKAADEGPQKFPFAGKALPIQQVLQFISEKTHKRILPDTEAVKKQIMILTTEEMELPEIIETVYRAMLESGVAVHEKDGIIHIFPVEKAKEKALSLVGADEPLPDVPKTQLVHKAFSVRNATVARVKTLLESLKPAYAVVQMEEAAGKLFVIDTLENLKMYEDVIRELDVVGADRAEIRIIPLEHADASEVVTIVNTIILGSPRGARPGRAPQPPKGGPPGGATGLEEVQPVIAAYPRTNWVVVSADARMLLEIEDLVKELDQERPPDVQIEVIPIEFADPGELAQMLDRMMRTTAGKSLQESINIVPYERGSSILVLGSKANRELIKKRLKDLDTEEAEKSILVNIPLKYADADKVAEMIKELYTSTQGYSGYDSYSYYRYGPGRLERPADIKVFADSRSNSVNVLAPPRIIEEIREKIDTIWDRELDEDVVMPRIIALEHTDAKKMEELLTDLFGEEDTSGRSPFYGYFFGSSRRSATSYKRDVGALFGQVRFKADVHTNAIIVVAKTADSLDAAEKLIKELDRQAPEFGNTWVSFLQHANCEDLSERLNAILSATGTPAVILRSKAQLERRAETTVSDQGQKADAQKTQQPQKAGTMQFWWAQGRREVDLEEVSSLIGKVRIVPDARLNALIISTPPEYAASVKKLVEDLDKPGRQVLIEAVVVQVDLEKLGGLGIRFSAEPILAGNPDVSDFGIGIAQEIGIESRAGDMAFVTDADVYLLIQALRKVTDVQVKSMPRLAVFDNEEAELFDGQDVPFIKQSRTSAEGTTTTSDFEYIPVGIRLQVRPHITPERRVELSVNLELSSIEVGRTLFGGAILDRRETFTSITLGDGQTVILSGIIVEKDLEIVRKVPVLGDIPILDLVFKSRTTIQHKYEIVAFVTAHVIANPREYDTVTEAARGTFEQRAPGITQGTDMSGGSPDEGI